MHKSIWKRIQRMFSSNFHTFNTQLLEKVDVKYKRLIKQLCFKLEFGYFGIYLEFYMIDTYFFLFHISKCRQYLSYQHYVDEKLDTRYFNAQMRHFLSAKSQLKIYKAWLWELFFIITFIFTIKHRIEQQNKVRINVCK